MDEPELLAQRFEDHRGRLRAVAYRMLGSQSEADDAVQESWLRLSRSDAQAIENLGAWLTTVVARIALNMLRSRDTRREEPFGPQLPEPVLDPATGADPEHQTLLGESVGLALFVVLDTLTPAERIAFVLHDMFAVPFDEIAPMIERTPAATRQLASRARRRVKGGYEVPEVDLGRQHQVVDAYLAAARGGDFDALLSLLDPDVVLRADGALVNSAVPILRTGAQAVAKGAVGATQRARFGELALVNGAVGLVVASGAQLQVVLRFTMADGKITEIDVIADRDRLAGLEIAVLD
jgi:RNA polymerase sigma factor (sigma-70 family)